MNTFKLVVCLIISVGVGSFINEIMDNVSVNVWIARAVGCLISTVVFLLFYKFYLEKGQ